MPPTRANGKICYLEIPAIDIARSSAFYEAVFHWQLRRRGDGNIDFVVSGIPTVQDRERDSVRN